MTDNVSGNNPPNDPVEHPSVGSKSATAAPQQGEVGAHRHNDADDEQTATKEMRREFRWFEFGGLVINGTLAIIGIIALCVYNGQHYCPAKISEGHPNPLKISMITHGRSENDFN